MIIPLMWQEEFENCIKNNGLDKPYIDTNNGCLPPVVLDTMVSDEQLVYISQASRMLHWGYCLAKHEQIMQDVEQGKCCNAQEIIDGLNS